jgi:hypothetical protein
MEERADTQLHRHTLQLTSPHLAVNNKDLHHILKVRELPRHSLFVLNTERSNDKIWGKCLVHLFDDCASVANVHAVSEKDRRECTTNGAFVCMRVYASAYSHALEMGFVRTCVVEMCYDACFECEVEYLLAEHGDVAISHRAQVIGPVLFTFFLHGGSGGEGRW